METVDDKYKAAYNMGYLLSQTPETAEIAKKMIERDKDPEHKAALEAGRRQFIKDEIAGQTITPKRERTESELLQEYYDGMDAAFERGDYDHLLTSAIEKEYKSLADEKEPPKEQFVPSERVGQGPALPDAQKKELEDFEHSQRAKDVTREAKAAAEKQDRIDENARRMQEARERRHKDKDRGRE